MKRHLKRIALTATCAISSTSLYAGIPVWTFSAPNPAQVGVSTSGTSMVQYTITNQSHKPKRLLLQTTTGLSASPCVLSANKGSTCTLTLQIDGSTLSQKGIHAGPVLCEEGNPTQCYQPS